MDITTYLKTVTNINEYISFTEDIQNKRDDLKVLLNISTILCIKDLRSIEIEYFNKCDENGGVTKVFELLLRSPPSKTWSLLGKELICLLQYWLDAIRKHLILHNTRWWIFLKLILKFINAINSKDVSLNIIIIEETAECLLDLATHQVPNAKQRSEILKTFNSISAEASRNIRLAYQEKFRKHFVKLSTLLASTGDFPFQQRILETLLRWLLPRHDPRVRRAAADQWFPEGLYSRRAVEIFLKSSWENFIKDSRVFLNAVNYSGDRVTSVICTTLTIGNRVYVSGKDKNNFKCWLDVNMSTKCISIMLDFKLVEDGCVVIHEENTVAVELTQESQRVLITVSVLDLSRVCPTWSDVTIPQDNLGIVRATICTTSDISRLDKALRGMFDGKYQTTIDFEKSAKCVSSADEQPSIDVINDTEEDTRFSIPPEVPRRRHAGYIMRSRNTGSWNSPSTASTSSLAQLHEKLAALPRYTYDKEPVSICAQPQLSTVSEVSETRENQTTSSLSTTKYRIYGIQNKKITKTESKTSHTTSDESNEIRNISQVLNNEENSISCMLCATIGSTDDSIISATINRLPKNVSCNTDNIVDLLAREALQGNRDACNGAIDTRNHQKSPDIQLISHFQTETPVCENENTTELLQENIAPNKQRIDETFNEIVENTPVSWVQVRRTTRKSNRNNSKSNTVLDKRTHGVDLINNNEAMENFFSQHYNETKERDPVICPSLARKINETSSECSEIEQGIESNRNIIHDELFLPDIDVVESLNAMVDKVCQDLDRHMDSSTEPNQSNGNQRPKRLKTLTANTKKLTVNIGNKNPCLENTPEENTTDENMTKQIRKSNKGVVLKFTKRKSLSCRKKTNKTNKANVEQQLFTVMPRITEEARESINTDNVDKIQKNNITSPMINDAMVKNDKTREKSPIRDVKILRRKRKLYSPKNETCHEKAIVHISETIENDTIKNSDVRFKTQNSNVTCYKEIEQARKKQIRKPRSRLSLKKVQLPISPKTLKMNQLFDSLKDVTDSVPVKVADKTELGNDLVVYNFTSDSEDEEVIKKSKNDSKKKYRPNANIVKTVMTRKSSKPLIETPNTLELIAEKNKTDVKCTRKLRSKKLITKCDKENVSKILEPRKLNLEDERMRAEVPDILNTSLINECPKNLEQSSDKNPEPVLNVIPKMEYIFEDKSKSKENNQNIKERQQKSKTKRMLSLKRNKDIAKVNLDNVVDNDRSVSPLPGLVVETVLTTEFDVNDSVSVMLQNLKDIFQDKQVPERGVSTTQNLLSNCSEPINYKSSNLNVNKELKHGTNTEPNKSNRQGSKKKTINKTKIQDRHKSPVAKSHTNDESEFIQLSANEDNSGRTMATMGNSHSPITAHGDFDEDPPNPTLLNKHIEPRIVEQEYLNQSLKDFFVKLTAQVNEQPCGENYDRSNYSVKKDTRTTDDHSSVKSVSKSPIVAITRLSPEYIRQISHCYSSVDSNNSKTELNDDSSPKTIKENFEHNKSYCNNFPAATKIKTAIKSTISPVKLFDDLNLITFKIATPQQSESEDDCLTRVKNILSSKNQPKLPTNYSVKMSERSSNRTAKKNLLMSSTPSSKHSLEENRQEESNSRPSKLPKRESSPVLTSVKRFKNNEVNNNFGSTITGSCSSLSSVNEWFKRNEPTSRGDSNSSVKEYIKNVLEKLDTTLIEIHHNTSKRFIDMFVDATSHLQVLKNKRKSLQQETAKEIISSVISVMDSKLLDLDNRLNAMEDEFIENLKKKAHDLIKEECKQKRVMVTLLREDIQAVMEHLEKNRISH